MIWDRKTPPTEAVIGIPLPEGGYRLRPYDDGSGNWTIGAGSLHMPDGSRVTAQSRAITLQEAYSLFAAELAPCLQALAAGTSAELTTGQAAALGSWLFNCGQGSLEGSKIQSMLAAGRYDLAVRQLGGWCEARDEHTHVLAPELGLMRRRQFEANLWAGMAPAVAYDQAWKLTLAEGMQLYRQAFADAAAWGSQPSPSTPAAAAAKAAPAAPKPAPHLVAAPKPAARPVAPPAASDDAVTDALNKASAAGTLTLTEGD